MWTVVCSLEILQAVFPQSAHVPTLKGAGNIKSFGLCLGNAGGIVSLGAWGGPASTSLGQGLD